MKIDFLESPISLVIDEVTGLPKSLTKKIDGNAVTQSLVCTLEIEVNGSERRAPTGGIEYYDTQTFKGTFASGPIRESSNHHAKTFQLPIKIGNVELSLVYTFNTHGPGLSMSLRFIRQEDVIVRNLILHVEITNIDEKSIINIPGNGLRSNIPVSVLTDSTGISPLGGLRGSSATIHLSNDVNSFVTWIDNDIELPESLVGFKDSSLQIKVTSNFASDLAQVSSLDVQLVSLDLHSGTWENFPPIFDTWLRTRGIVSPANPPTWVKPAMIFEAQIGFSVFAKVNHYSPYPEVENLIDDLDRIKKLGFTCIQLMPRQPYPSYNVHDYWDIDTSYGKESEIKRLVQEAHKRGIKVIFDVLLHGILDKEIIKTAADGVRFGPFSSLIEAKTEDSFSADVKDWHNYLIAWSRHIIDFEPYWSDGSPAKTELENSHPDWFYRFSSGEIAGVYTKAFDARNAEWQEYFTNAMLNLVEKLDIDGFRFDAPTYNDFYNWAPWARYRAGASALACTGLFEKMRPIFKEKKSDFLFYTEPSGLSLRRSMDLNYNYDEQWLVTSLVSQEARSLHGITNGKDLALWMRDRDALLPRGSMTAHHIDSHDTFWWPSWGIKWRREQFGLKMTQLLNCIFGALPGPFMMFVGGEEGIEDILPKIATFKQSDEYRLGEHHWWVEKSIPDELFGISYQSSEKATSVVVNPSNSTVKVNLKSWRETLVHESLVGSAIIRENELVIESQSAVILKHHLS